MELKLAFPARMMVTIIFVTIAVSTMVDTGPVPFTNCPSSGIFPVTSVDIINSTTGKNCSDGSTPCKIVGGHTYKIEFGGCHIESFTELITAKPYNVIADITIPILGQIPILDNLPISQGDLCHHFAPSSPVQSCPMQAPVCCSFRISVTALIVALPPLLELPCANGTIYGRAWENLYGTNSKAAGCIQIPINYKLT